MTGLIEQMRPAPNGGLIHPRDPGEPGGKMYRKRWSVTQPDISVLQCLARDRIALEIGTGLGVSATALAAVCPRVVTLDIDAWVEREIAPHLPPNVEFIASREAIDPDERFSFVFVDGLHQTDAVASDLTWALERFDAPGVIVCHDGIDEQVIAGIQSAGFAPQESAFVPTPPGLAVLFVGSATR